MMGQEFVLILMKMLSWKFKYICLTPIIFCSFILCASTGVECLNSDFMLKISHKVLPFGLLNNDLSVDKHKCEIKINYRKLKFLKTEFIVDVCREPIHLKKEGLMGLDIIKRKIACDDGAQNEFCELGKNLKGIILNEGLVYAQGEKEDLNSEHGKLYCAFSLIKKYIDNGLVLSRYDIFAGDDGKGQSGPASGSY